MTINTTRIDREGLWQRIQQSYAGENVPEIARQLKKQKQSVYRWRDGETPGLDTLAEISRSRNVSLHWLLTGEGPERLSNENGYSLRPEERETQKAAESKTGSEVRVLSAQMTLIIEQNHRIIELLEKLANKGGAED